MQQIIVVIVSTAILTGLHQVLWALWKSDYWIIPVVFPFAIIAFVIAFVDSDADRKELFDDVKQRYGWLLKPFRRK